MLVMVLVVSTHHCQGEWHVWFFFSWHIYTHVERESLFIYLFIAPPIIPCWCLATSSFGYWIRSKPNPKKKCTKLSCSSVKHTGNMFFLIFSYQASKSWSTRQKPFKNISSISMFPPHIWQLLRLFRPPQFWTAGSVGSFIACQWNWCARMMKRTLNMIFWKDCFAVFGEQRHTTREIKKTTGSLDGMRRDMRTVECSYGHIGIDFAPQWSESPYTSLFKYVLVCSLKQAS